MMRLGSTRKSRFSNREPGTMTSSVTPYRLSLVTKSFSAAPGEVATWRRPGRVPGNDQALLDEETGDEPSILALPALVQTI
jgi:hypothetical protein